MPFLGVASEQGSRVAAPQPPKVAVASPAAALSAPNDGPRPGAAAADAPERDSPLLDMSDAAVKKLLETAKARGYVTYEQLNTVLPCEEVSSDQIEMLLNTLADMGITVVEGESDEELCADAAGGDEDERLPAPEIAEESERTQGCARQRPCHEYDPEIAEESERTQGAAPVAAPSPAAPAPAPAPSAKLAEPASLPDKIPAATATVATVAAKAAAAAASAATSGATLAGPAMPAPTAPIASAKPTERHPDAHRPQQSAQGTENIDFSYVKDEPEETEDKERTAALESDRFAGLASERLGRLETVVGGPSGSLGEDQLSLGLARLRSESEAAGVAELENVWGREQRLPEASTESRIVVEMAEHVPPPSDLVECSVFAPASPSRASRILIQALLHKSEQLAQAIKMAHEIVPDANQKGFAKLKTRITRGSDVSLFLVIPALEVERPLVRLYWSGEPLRAVYSVVVPEHVPLGPCQGRLLVMVKDVQVGEIEFALSIAERRPAVPAMPVLTAGSSLMGSNDPGALDDRTSDDPTAVATRSRNFDKAFISYSRKDFVEVSRHAETLEECGVTVLIDVTAIPRGAEWEKEIPRLVNAADVVYVMWSDNAAMSAWVDKEARHAVDLYDARPEQIPRIVPMLVHTPAPQLHDYLQRFNVRRDWPDRRTAHQAGPLFKSPEGNGA